MSEQAGKVSDGIAEDTGDARQARTARSGQDGTETPMLIDQVVSRKNLIRAYERVVRNQGAAGVDGMTVDDLMPYCREHWSRIREELLNGAYRPQAVRKVEIPKPGGKGIRTLGIPTVLDRLIQQALLQVLQPIFDPTFSDANFGFRPGRSTHQAIVHACAHMSSGYRWVVDMDLEKFFDRVNHDVLMSRVARRVKDKKVLLLIRRFLQAGMMEGGLVSPRAEGTPQGGPLSPLLSNILLDELDKELEWRGHRFVRYADDCNIYVRSKRSGERVLDSVERFVTKRLRLRVNRDKSAVDRPWNRKFLGYTVTSNRQPKLKVAPQSVKRLKAKLRPMLRRGRGRNLGRVAESLTRVLRGWVAYYKLAEVKASFEELDQWLRRKLRCILWRQWKRHRTQFKELCRRGLDHERARRSAWNGRGPWYNAGASHMNHAVPTSELRGLGLISLMEEYRRLACSS
ncbi:MAG: group II intron reverse transcriptase/maturase [Planctomycetota bacterium]|jgi:RNA-directed DNA polymerase